MSEDKMNKGNKEKKEEIKEETAEKINNKEKQAEGKGKEEGKKSPEKKEVNKKKSRKDKKELKIEELETKLKNLSDKHLRLQAEFDNYRKRTVKEKAELIKSGGESVLSGVLPVVDDFERALKSLEEVPDDDAGKQGAVLIYNKFKEFLNKNNVKEIVALNEQFDVDHHEALTKIPAPEDKLKGKVVDVIQKGYTLNEKVIRYAKVVVGE